MGRLENAIPRQKNAEFDEHEKKDKRAYDLVKNGKVLDAVKLFQENLDWSQKALGRDHAATLYDKESLAFYLNELKRFKEAAKLDEEVLEVRTRVEGASPPSMALLETQRNLANDYLGVNEVKKAADMYEKNYEMRRKQLGLGEDNIDTLRVGHELAACWHRLREFKKAKDLNAKILASRIRLEMSELDIISSREALAFNHIELGALEVAEMLYLENIRSLKGMTGENAHPGILKNNERSLGVCVKQMRDQKKQGNSSKDNAPKEEDPKKRSPKGEETKAVGKINQPVTENLPKKQQNQDTTGSNEKEPGKKPWQKREQRQNTEQDSGDKSMPIPIPTINTPVSDIQEKPLSYSVRDHIKRLSLDLGNRKENQDIPRRVKSQHGRPDRTFEFRHVKSSEALSELDNQSKNGSSDQESRYGPIPGSIAGSWRINPADLNFPLARRPGGLHPWHAEPTSNKTPETPKSVSPPRTPSPARSVSDIKRYGQLFDAEEGNYDEDSIKTVDNWFKLLNEETQALLENNRKNQCKRVKIAILDTGIDLKHPDFADDQAKPLSERRIKRPVDFLDPKSNGKDSCGHGTHCAGLLRKIAPWADIYVARVAKDFDGEIDPVVVAKAISRASGTGVDSDGKKKWNVDIISLSLGFYGGSKAVQTAIQDAINNNTLVFAAASNGGTQREMTFPAWLEGVVCVNCALANGKPSGFNPPIQGANNFSIIGVNVKSAWIREEGKEPYKRMSGTSVATPIAAGVAALVLEFALQNDPDSFMKDLEYLKHYNGMTEVFAAMSNTIDGYRNIVPWIILKERMQYQSQKEAIWAKIAAEGSIRHHSRKRTTFNDMYTMFVQSAFLEYPNEGHDGQIYAAERNLWAFLFDTVIDFPGTNPTMSRAEVGNVSLDLDELPDAGAATAVEGSDLDMVPDNIPRNRSLFSAPIPTTQPSMRIASPVSANLPAAAGAISTRFTSPNLPVHSATTLQVAARPSRTGAGSDIFGRRNAGFEPTNPREAAKRTRESSSDGRLYREDQRIPNYPAPWVYDPEDDEDLYDE